jgi:hypothetical protein
MTALLWTALARLFAAAILPANRLRFSAAVGSGLVLAAFFGYPLVGRLAVSLGYMHTTTRLAFSTSWIDLLRMTVEPQVWVLLLAFSIVSFALSVHSLVRGDPRGTRGSGHQS